MSDIRPAIQITHEFICVSEKNETITSATVERVHGVLWVTNVWCHHEHRRKGYATEVLQTVIDMFGREDLWLSVRPYTNRPLSTAVLAEWYGKFGFKPTSTPGAMCRRATL